MLDDWDYNAGSLGPIDFAEKITALFSESSRSRKTATYKYAVVLGLMDLCFENTSKSGLTPTMITTRQLAEKVLQLYWDQTKGYQIGNTTAVLTQNASRTQSQAEIIKSILNFRQRYSIDPSASRLRSRISNPDRYEILIRTTELKLIEMPLPRLQYYGNCEDRFLYEIDWTKEETEGRAFTDLRRRVRAYQEGDGESFNNSILLRPNVGANLIILNNLLRPMIHQRWAAMVARINSLPESRLEDFLFGEKRTMMARVRLPLLELQDGRCFYCRGIVDARRDLEVDHYVPWSRHANNCITNLVVAHKECNMQKCDYLASAEHLCVWLERNVKGASAGNLADIARTHSWEHTPDRTLAVARGIYLNLPNGAPVWVSGKKLLLVDRTMKDSFVELLVSRF
jgi:hypothetical protein